MVLDLSSLSNGNALIVYNVDSYRLHMKNKILLHNETNHLLLAEIHDRSEQKRHSQRHQKRRYEYHRGDTQQQQLNKQEPLNPEPYRNIQEHRLIQKEQQRLRKERQRSLGFTQPVLFRAPPNTRNQQFEQHQIQQRPPKSYQRRCTCDQLTSEEDSESMFDMEEMRLNEMILQTFEEMENVFSFPLTTQREARAFMKVLHNNKGLSYKFIGSTIGESEHELVMWQGGQANQQVGRMMIARINLPLVELLSSDEEDETDAVKELTKKNNVKQGTAKTKKDPVHLVAGDKKQQQATDLTSSWMKQIETKMATVEAEPSGDNWKDDDSIDGGNRPQANSAGEMPPEQRNRRNNKESPHCEEMPTEERNMYNHKKTPPAQNEPVPELRRESVAFEVVQNAQRSSARKEKQTLLENDKRKDHSARVPTKLPASHRNVTKSTELPLVSSETSTETPSDIAEVVEEPISKAVALENFACILNQNRTPTDLSTATDTSAASIVTETIVPHVAGENTARHQLLLETNEPSNRSGSSDWQLPAEESNLEDYQQEVNENYDSDLDVDNGDVSTQTVIIRKHIRTIKMRMDDGTGYLYVFSDNSGGKYNRVKVGTSRFPAKRLEQASMFNVDIQLVSAISVNMRKSALNMALKALQQYQLPDQKSWFNAPLPRILDIVSGVAAKFPLQTASFA